MSRRETLAAIADLHVEVPENRQLTDSLRPANAGDWLIVCGDVGQIMADIEWALSMLADRYEKVIWVPGNHDLWTCPEDPVQLRGDDRYRYLVRYCQQLGITTPDDAYPVWNGPGGPALIAPLFTLYDYSFGVNIAPTPEQALELAYEAGVVCSDEIVLHPDPYVSRAEWSRERIGITEERLTTATAHGLPLVLVDHFPLRAELTRALFYQEFAQWCGSVATADWHTRFRAVSVVYGHLHIPGTTVLDGVPFEEVSLGYPREWKARNGSRTVPRQILPEEAPPK